MMRVGRRRRRRNELGLAIAIVVVVLLGSSAWWVYRDWDLEMQCRLRLSRPYYAQVRRNDELIPPEELASRAEAGQFYATCPESGKRYVYRPVEGPLRNWNTPSESLRMIAWCPTHCHRGGRNVMLENGGAYIVSEAIFQKAVVGGLVMTSTDIVGNEMDQAPP